MKQRAKGWLARLRKDPRNLFWLVSAAGILGYFLLSFRYGGRLYAWMIQENSPAIRFIDYFSHLSDASDRMSLYSHFSGNALSGYRPLFPPLAYCMYHFLFRLTSLPDGSVTGLPPETVPGALSVFTLWLVFTAVLFFAALGLIGKRNRKKDLALFTLLTLSAVFAGSGFLTGNSAMLALGLTAAGLGLSESPSPRRRKAGILLLALSVALKLYPAVFGLLFLKEKKYKDLLLLVLLSLALVLVPFVFFGGVSALQTWLDNLFRPLQQDYGRPQYLKGVFFSLIRDLTGRDASGAGTALSAAVCLLWAFLAWRSRSRQRAVFFLTCIMVFFPANSFRYTLAFFAVPLAMLLKEEPGEPLRAWPAGVVSALYGMLFTVPVWILAVVPMDLRYDFYALTSVEIWLYLTAYVLAAVMTAAELTDRGPRRVPARRP